MPVRFTENEQKLIGKLIKYFTRERNAGKPLLPVAAVHNRVADALEISIRSVEKIAAEGIQRDSDYKIKVHAGHISARGAPLYKVHEHTIRSRVYAMYSAVSLGNALNHFGTHLKNTVSHDQFHGLLHKHSHNYSVQACSNFENEMKNATHGMEECVHKTYNPDVENLCHFISQKFKSCAQPTIDLLGKCLPKVSKGVPNFIFDMILALFDYGCHARGSELLELTQPCIGHTLRDIFHDSLCENELSLKLSEFGRNFPTKPTICELLKTFRKCLEVRLESDCTSSITRAIFFHSYDAMCKPCKVNIK